MRCILALLVFCSWLPASVYCQNSEKMIFDNDSTSDYYLAVRPLSGNIQGVQVLIVSFNSPEFVLPETKLQNVGYGNNLLTIIASMGMNLYADSSSVARLNAIFKHVIKHFSVDTSKFVLGGFIYAGNIALRYTEYCYENPAGYPVLPKAVFAIDCPVDLLSLQHWCEREIKKNYSAGVVGDGKFISGEFAKKLGNISTDSVKYIQASPFYTNAQSDGNERFLKNIPVRLYYDTDISWELKNKRNSYFDTFIPDGSEMINRLMLDGNNEAEFMPARQPGMRSNGIRNPHSWSVLDEVECVQWIKEKLKIFNPATFVPVYLLPVPDGWSVERFFFPPDFANKMDNTGIEDVRFFPGWGNPKSEEYWSYAFLWWLEGNLDISAGYLQDNLKKYYTGLIARNIPIRKIPPEKVFPVTVKIQNIKTAAGDLKTFQGNINMLDYMAQAPMVLNEIIHVKDCPDKNHSYLFFEVSPKPFGHQNWDKMNQLNADFQCRKP